MSQPSGFFHSMACIYVTDQLFAYGFFLLLLQVAQLIRLVKLTIMSLSFSSLNSSLFASILKASTILRESFSKISFFSWRVLFEYWIQKWATFEDKHFDTLTWCMIKACFILQMKLVVIRFARFFNWFIIPNVNYL